VIDLVQAAAWMPLVWSGAVASVSLEAARRARAARALGRAGEAGAEAARAAMALRVLVIRPCAGREPFLDRTLGSLERARCSASLRCVFAIAEEGDEAAPAAGAAARALRAAGIPARVAVTAPDAPNRKAAQIAAAVVAEPEPFDVLLVADSDVDLDGLDLDLLIAPLAGPGPVAAVWAPPAEVALPRSFGDRASAAVLGGSLHAFPLLAGLDPRGLVGKLFAVRGGALARAGGFGSLAAHLGEDMELGRRLRAQGGEVRAAPMVAPSLACGRTLGAVVTRYARWITVIRAQRAALLPSYPGLFFATPLVVVASLVAALFAPWPAAAPAFAALGLAVAARLLLAAEAARAAGRRTSLATAAADAGLADLVLMAAFARAISSRTVVWRSAVLTVDRRGLLRGAAA